VNAAFYSLLYHFIRGGRLSNQYKDDIIQKQRVGRNYHVSVYRGNRLILGARRPRSKREVFLVFPKLANLAIESCSKHYPACAEKRGHGGPSLFGVYKVPDKSRKNAALNQQLLCTFSRSCFGVNGLYNYEHWLLTLPNLGTQVLTSVAFSILLLVLKLK
jgi:hypothetical protein